MEDIEAEKKIRRGKEFRTNDERVEALQKFNRETSSIKKGW